MAEFLHDTRGRRLYLTGDERRAFLEAAAKFPRPARTFCGVLAFTGCRVSEALQLTPRRGVYRAMPVPAALLDQLDLVHGLGEARGRGGQLDRPLAVDAGARLAAGQGGDAGGRGRRRAARDGEGVASRLRGARDRVRGAAEPAEPVDGARLARGHRAVYADALGAEEQGIAARMWN